ncbi:chromosome partitioning protein ParB [Afipia sp. P52-10]|uniref:ParB-like protein n=1 Tax=Afipia sp. P52-10 TaxID=1429916 RepID=UPI0003DF1E2B|nr:ParB-like protein [Afipia sp. P52-10]ETR77318.1 chromosome partitioning protein ParB [Afipia sp. P52-10]
MHSAREPLLKPVKIKDLRPTQITVGMHEVASKRKRWRDEGDEKGAEFLGRHMIPVVMGPKKRPFVIDHHHLALALQKEGVEHVLITVVSDLSHLEKDAFWIVLDNRSWMHPFDDKGRRRDYKDIPGSVEELVDDPYRSLAGALRRAGGFAKDTTPFSEFLWADFMRRRIKRPIVQKDFERALDLALELAKGQDASYLPGWCGPVDKD